MQTNRFLSPKTAELIDRQVEKLLKDLGNPPPPLRTLLKLDLAYYSSTDDSWLREKIHQMLVAGKQVLARPVSILSVVRRLGLKGILLAQQRRILLDNEIPAKLRWNECHEIIEAEANYGAGRLLFLGQGFTDVVRSTRVDFAAVRSWHETYGNTIASTLWRVVELSLEPTFGW